MIVKQEHRRLRFNAKCCFRLASRPYRVVLIPAGILILSLGEQPRHSAETAQRKITRAKQYKTLECDRAAFSCRLACVAPHVHNKRRQPYLEENDEDTHIAAYDRERPTD